MAIGTSLSVFGGYSVTPMVGFEPALELIPGLLFPDVRMEYSFGSGNESGTTYNLAISKYSIGISYLVPIVGKNFKIGGGVLGGMDFMNMTYPGGYDNSLSGSFLEGLGRCEWDINRFLIRLDVGYGFDIQGIRFVLSTTSFGIKGLIIDLSFGIRTY